MALISSLYLSSWVSRSFRIAVLSSYITVSAPLFISEATTQLRVFAHFEADPILRVQSLSPAALVAGIL